MRRFFRECRAAAMTRGLAGLVSLPLAAGVLEGTQAHLGLPADVLAALSSAGMTMAAGLTTFVLISRFLAVRRRKQADHRS